ncbi:MFS general substrate transporter [Aspergillus steynii IBT 23096]|uniref:MFS general substrate transporter n=1 Tax=Aspergillus steynii IBT 23096 TaxID=1392250 RepID=A0A2I2G3A0_9EURO|nr:MFS general substrate transporter [Aspergillus steynii IBT 23096]PLB47354.1 MFS general substrate transporter [Aspergillus steynii IBT 23096]
MPPKFLNAPGKLRLYSPFVQNIVMGCVLFCLPGIYIALTGLGAGGGQASSQETTALANSILYGVFTVAGWCAGPVLNHLKPKWTAVIGAIGYPVYVGSLWYYDRAGGQVFPLLAAALLGICAGLLWTTSGCIQFAYPEEKDKATYITLQCILQSSGSTVGALVAFGVTMNGGQESGVSSAVYIAFILVMAVAIVGAAIFIVDPEDVVRDDGRHIATFEKPTVKREILGVLSVMTDPKIIIMLPAMFVAEMCLAMVSSVNAYYFNLRTRSLNNLLFQAVMIPTPLILAYILDNKHVKSRRLRGVMGTTFTSLITMGATCGLLPWVIRNQVDRERPSAVDWTDSSSAAAMALYILFGIVYACFQIGVQWTLAALTNDPALCARYSGASKGTVSLGMCVSFTVDSQGMSFRNQVIMQLVLYCVGICSLYYVIIVYVRQTNYFVEESVIVPTGMENVLDGIEKDDGTQRRVEENEQRSG